MKQPELFEPTPEQKRLALERNPMARVHGYFDEKAKCKKCKFLCYHQRSKRYYKCRKRGVTKGEGTDHRVNWLACSFYEKVQCETCWDTGKLYRRDCPDCQGDRSFELDGKICAHESCNVQIVNRHDMCQYHREGGEL